jgi:DNA modification methylase
MLLIGDLGIPGWQYERCKTDTTKSTISSGRYRKMNMQIDIATIDIPNPTSEIDEKILAEMTDSLKEHGLSHQIIVRPATNKPGRYELASGEKRLLAAKRLGWTKIEADVRNITENRAKEIRLHENLRRFNLPWHEQVILVEELHRLRQEEHGVAQRGRPAIVFTPQPKAWTIKDTAEELGIGEGNLSEDLRLARALRNDPTLSKVTDKKTAIKLVRIAAQQDRDEHSAMLPKSGKEQELINQILFGDSSEILKQLPKNSIDCCITDPPWVKYFDAKLRIDERTVPVFKELFRVLKPNSLVYVFAGFDDFSYYTGTNSPNPSNPQETIHKPGVLEGIGYSVSLTPIIWQKLKSLSRRGVRAWEYARDFEYIVVAANGSPTLTSIQQMSGVKPFDIVPPASCVHPNEKPAALIKQLLTEATYEKNLVIDPFAGSGVLGVACRETKRNYLMIERDRAFYEKICKRMGKSAK